jgi:hypothetical protein
MRVQEEAIERRESGGGRPAAAAGAMPRVASDRLIARLQIAADTGECLKAALAEANFILKLAVVVEAPAGVVRVTGPLVAPGGTVAQT